MATNEVSFRRELVKAFAPHGHAVTISQRFVAGTPDVYIKMRGLPAFWLELKFIGVPNKGGTIPLQLTALQRHFLTLEHDAGGFAGWAVCAPAGHRWKRGWSIFAGHNPEQRVVSVNEPTTVRYVGHPWDVKAIAEKILTVESAP